MTGERHHPDKERSEDHVDAERMPEEEADVANGDDEVDDANDDDVDYIDEVNIGDDSLLKSS